MSTMSRTDKIFSIDAIKTMQFVNTQSSASWLTENGPKELECLFRAFVFLPSAAILVVDDEGHCREASIGASKLLGLPREEIIDRRIEEFVVPALQPLLLERWQAFLQGNDQIGRFRMTGPDGAEREVEYAGKRGVLPFRHLLLLRANPTESGEVSIASTIPHWAEDYALFLLDVDGGIVAWYGGAERIYGYESDEVPGKDLSLFYPPDERLRSRLERKLKRVAAEGHVGSESWHLRKDGSRFWGSSITMALRDEAGVLHGFGRAVRDFSDRYERDEKLERRRPRMRSEVAESTIDGVVSGQFDRVLEMNDRFLEIVGYTREDLLAGRINWPNLTPESYSAADEFAHEQALRFGACSPYEKELIRKDGKRVTVLVATAVLKLSPFRWITFVTVARDRNRRETADSRIAETKNEFKDIIGNSRTIKRVLSQVELVAPTDATVLILGETGTGKELIARALHRLSPRRDLPFISLNCAAIPSGLLESELFGYERGAFTGALQQKIGRFEMANGGTLFLDEVGDIPLELQPKLLRALQEKSFERLGSTRTLPVNVRLVAATNRNLTQMVGDKIFRSDLYYRLKVFPLSLPPLRDRPEDIPLLARHFNRKHAERLNRRIDRIHFESMKAMTDWTWPGNVRELESFIEKSVILSDGNSLQAPVAELREDLVAAPGSVALEDVERDHILRIFRETGGSVSRAATLLRLERTTLNGKMKKLGISRADL